MYFDHALLRIRAVVIVAIVAVASGFAGSVPSASARERIQVVGSSTVFPFATIVAERFGKSTRYKSPVVESTGSGGGFKLFCAGVGLNHPDATGASRRMKFSEYQQCKQNGVTATEFIIGSDGLVFARNKSAEAPGLSIAHIAAAIAARLPVDGTVVDNPNQTWADVDRYVSQKMNTPLLGLPNIRVRVLVPPPTSGTRDALVDLFIARGHKKLGTYEAVGKKASKALREDGAAIEVGENDNLIIEKLVADKDLFGVFGFSFYDQNRDKVRPSAIDGVALSFDTISDYSYPGARPLFSYVKREHLDVIPGLRKLYREFLSEKALGLDGYLFPAGLVPPADLPGEQQKLKTFPAVVIPKE